MKIKKYPLSSDRINRRESLRLFILGVLGAKLFGCSKNQYDPHADKKTEIQTIKEKKVEINPNLLDADRIERVEVDGDPNVGTVIVINQIHSTLNMNEDHLVNVGEVQYRIVQELIKIGTKHIFQEGSSADFTCEGNTELDRLPFSVIRSMVRDMFESDTILCVDNKLEERCKDPKMEDKPECDPDLIYRKRSYDRIENLKSGDSCEQENYRGMMVNISQGAGKIYACLKPDVTVHRLHSEGDELLLRVKEVATKEVKNEDEHKRFKKEMSRLSPEREKNAVGRVMNFLESNQGQTVVLIFGGAHSFKDDFSILERPPLVKLITFPNLIREKFFQITGDKLEDKL